MNRLLAIGLAAALTVGGLGIASNPAKAVGGHHYHHHNHGYHGGISLGFVFGGFGDILILIIAIIGLITPTIPIVRTTHTGRIMVTGRLMWATAMWRAVWHVTGPINRVMKFYYRRPGVLARCRL